MITERIILILLFFTSFPMHARSRSFRMYTIMLDPAGDARETGRTIEDSLERALTIQFAQQLKESIESYLPNSNVMITRSAGEVMQPLQNCNFANRMVVDLYISINFVHAVNKKPTLYLYQFSLGDTFMTPSYDLCMLPYDKAHQKSASTSTQYGNTIKQFLSDKEYQRLFTTAGFYQLPFAPLIGIQAPAIGLEMSIPSKKDWQKFVQPTALSIATALEN